MNFTKEKITEQSLELFDLDLYDNSSHERGFVSSARIGISVCIWNIAVNLLLMLFILCVRRTRRQFVMLQISNIAVIDLLTSVLVDSFTIYYDLGHWALGQTMCEAWLVFDAMLPFASFIGIILLNFDRLIFAIRPSFYYSLFMCKPVRWTFFSTPWFLSAVIIVPIWLCYDVPINTDVQDFMCIYALTDKAAVASSVISLFLPSLAIIVLTLFVLVTVVSNMPTNLNEFSSATFDEHRLSQRALRRRHNSIVLALCIVNFCSLLMQLPFGTISLLGPQCPGGSCASLVRLLQTLGWLRSATPGMRPVIWFLFTEIKYACCCCIHNESDNRAQMESFQMASSCHTQNENLTSVTAVTANGHTNVK